MKQTRGTLGNVPDQLFSVSSAIKRRGSLREEGDCEQGARLVRDPLGEGSTPLQDVEVSMGSAAVTQPTWFHAAYCTQDSAGISV